jgi:hypothetical protein
MAMNKQTIRNDVWIYAHLNKENLINSIRKEKRSLREDMILSVFDFLALGWNKTNCEIVLG